MNSNVWRSQKSTSGKGNQIAPLHPSIVLKHQTGDFARVAAVVIEGIGDHQKQYSNLERVSHYKDLAIDQIICPWSIPNTLEWHTGPKEVLSVGRTDPMVPELGKENMMTGSHNPFQRIAGRASMGPLARSLEQQTQAQLPGNLNVKLHKRPLG
jgi:hypothetical protein